MGEKVDLGTGVTYFLYNFQEIESLLILTIFSYFLSSGCSSVWGIDPGGSPSQDSYFSEQRTPQEHAFDTQAKHFGAQGPYMDSYMASHSDFLCQTFTLQANVPSALNHPGPGQDNDKTHPQLPSPKLTPCSYLTSPTPPRRALPSPSGLLPPAHLWSFPPHGPAWGAMPPVSRNLCI